MHHKCIIGTHKTIKRKRASGTVKYVIMLICRSLQTATRQNKVERGRSSSNRFISRHGRVVRIVERARVYVQRAAYVYLTRSETK